MFVDPAFYVYSYQLSGMGVDCEVLKNAYKYRYSTCQTSSPGTYTIPKKYHLIWITDPLTPKEVSEGVFAVINSNKKLLDPSSVWELNFWTNSPTSITKTTEKMIELGFNIRSVYEPHIEINSQVLDQVIPTHNFAIAADYTRYKVIYTEGGIYSDLNYLFNKSPEALMQGCEFVAPVFRSGYLVDNHLIAAAPKSEILEDAIKTMESFYTDTPNYMKGVFKANLHPELESVYKSVLPFNAAIFKNLGPDKPYTLLPTYILHPYPEYAKHHTNMYDLLIKYDEEEPKCEGDGCCYEEMVQNYLDYDICTDTPLGYDLKGSKSWLEVEQLWAD